VEIDLMAFKRFASSQGHPEISATTVDLLKGYGVDISKISTEEGVKLRFHQEEVITRRQFWEILRIIQEMNILAKQPVAV
jgi:hypothetical protein